MYEIYNTKYDVKFNISLIISMNNSGVSVALVSILGVILLVESGSLTICPLILKYHPGVYTQYWEAKTAVIIAFVIAIINLIGLLSSIVIGLLSRGANDGIHYSRGIGWEMSAWIYMIVFTALNYYEIRQYTLGKWVVYYIIIGHPCFMLLACIII